MCSKYPPSAFTRDLSSARRWSMDALMTHFQCCPKRLAGAKYHTRGECDILRHQHLLLASYDHITLKNNK